MAHFLLQASYTSAAWAALAREPEDRVAAIKPVIERLGGRVVTGYLSFGEYDIVAIVELPNSVSAAAFSMASSGGGAIRVRKTTPLLTPEEARQAMQLAGGTAYPVPHALQSELAQEAANLVASVGE
ncbi:MAG TPA: GYD domain-containing protein [Dehalococcoidia bacterium]|nr:GYD domain-containing protein [Dehalococcoidia bacterium]